MLRIFIIKLFVRIIRLFYRTKSANNAKLMNDPRVDPRIKKNFWFDIPVRPSFKSREEMMKYYNSSHMKREYKIIENFSEVYDDKKLAPLEGLRIETKEISHRQTTTLSIFNILDLIMMKFFRVFIIFMAVAWKSYLVIMVIIGHGVDY